MFNLAFVGGLTALLLVPSAASTGAAPAVLAPSAVTASAVSPSAVPPLGRVTVNVVTVNGSGCPAGTASVAETPDNSGFTVAYSAFTATAGGNADPTDFRKNCQLVVRLSVPQGFTYAVARAEYRGTASLAAGAVGTQLAGYYFQGSSETARIPHTVAGPYNGTWRTEDSTDGAALVYAPCGVQRDLNINAELRVDAGSSDPSRTSTMTMGASRGSVQTVYQLSWATCS